ncbi:MAG: S-adenosylmethionine:tRNA ribosyltransferase-isomerase [Bacteroidaceae bacterium]|nr:S-adenosylmethionine:tRNA ribosyltransferase-isomerase [Bacteroidaceae bacterium]
MQTKDIQIQDYNYPLPDSRIAKYPLADRSASKLLVRSISGEIHHDSFQNLTQYLAPNSLMVFNNTKVIQARLHFHKSTGALIEIFCLEPCKPVDYQLSFASIQQVSWTCLVGNLKKWKEGKLTQEVMVKGEPITLTAERLGNSSTGFEIQFCWNSSSVCWSEILESLGELPIPPYLNRSTEESDLQTYQTVYSKIKGSVAAPTAGLHFTDEILAQLDQLNIERNEVTLHVGAGTFKPVKSERIGQHPMHAEWISVHRSTIERLLAHDAQCVAVGTTSVRTIESLYYIGIIILRAVERQEDLASLNLSVAQWMPYDEAELASRIDAKTSLKQILQYMDVMKTDQINTTTQIIIAPGYQFKIVKTIITNFHQPQSTLLLLVSAFVGGRWREIYDYALDHEFRFLSYGDSSILNFDALS